MTSHEDIQTALREYLKTLLVCEAEAVDELTPLSLGASAAGFTRNDGGSFLDDGFCVGMEVVSGDYTKSANQGPKMITAVSSTLITCSGCAVEAPAEGRTLEVGLPQSRSWENVAFERQIGVTHVVEQYVPGPESAPAFPNDMELRPMYFPQIFVPAGKDITAGSRYADALRRHFTPKTKIAVGNGDYIRGRADAATSVGQRNNSIPGFSMVPVTIPLRVRTQIT